MDELLRNIAPHAEIAQHFYQTFLLSLVQDLMVIMTDRQHKSGFKSQAAVLMRLFHLVQTGEVTVPLFDLQQYPGIDNVTYMKEFVGNLVLEAFPNLGKSHVVAFVLGLFDVSMDLNGFKQHLRDFLVQIKEFSGDDNGDLFIDEREATLELERQESYRYRASVPGLLQPSEFELQTTDYDVDGI